ncbi:exosome non-catalytic core subunit rrp40, partial [Spiromyces aspiralis]
MKSSQGSLQVVLPGERIVDLQEQQQDAEENGEAMSVCLGPGLIQTGDHVQAINAGLLRHIPKENKWWVQSN